MKKLLNQVAVRRIRYSEDLGEVEVIQEKVVNEVEVSEKDQGKK